MEICLAKLNWTWKGGIYQAPPTPNPAQGIVKCQIFENAKQIMSFLDGHEVTLAMYEYTYVAVPNQQQRKFVT